MIRERKRDAERSVTSERPNLRTVGPEDAPPTVKLALGENAPVPDAAAVPAGYQLALSGIRNRTGR